MTGPVEGDGEVESVGRRVVDLGKFTTATQKISSREMEMVQVADSLRLRLRLRLRLGLVLEQRGNAGQAGTLRGVQMLDRIDFIN
jgi:hypothetical protein